MHASNHFTNLLSFMQAVICTAAQIMPDHAHHLCSDSVRHTSANTCIEYVAALLAVRLLGQCMPAAVWLDINPSMWVLCALNYMQT